VRLERSSGQAIDLSERPLYALAGPRRNGKAKLEASSGANQPGGLVNQLKAEQRSRF
jgi:hypothetical protein